MKQNAENLKRDLAFPEKLADNEMMVPVDMRGIDEEFDDVEQMMAKLGAKGTAEAFIKAADFTSCAVEENVKFEVGDQAQDLRAGGNEELAQGYQVCVKKKHQQCLKCETMDCNFEEYADRMKEGQNDVYCIAGESTAMVSSSPFFENLRKKGHEVCYMADSVDEFGVQQLKEFARKKLKPTIKEGLDLGDELKIEPEPLTTLMKEALGVKVEEAIASGSQQEKEGKKRVIRLKGKSGRQLLGREGRKKRERKGVIGGKRWAHRKEKETRMGERKSKKGRLRKEEANRSRRT